MDNILLDMLRRVEKAGGRMTWNPPADRQQWIDESMLLMACENESPPLLELSNKKVTGLEPPETRGLLQYAVLVLLPAGKGLLNKHPA